MTGATLAEAARAIARPGDRGWEADLARVVARLPASGAPVPGLSLWRPRGAVAVVPGPNRLLEEAGVVLARVPTAREGRRSAEVAVVAFADAVVAVVGTGGWADAHGAATAGGVPPRGSSHVAGVARRVGEDPPTFAGLVRASGDEWIGGDRGPPRGPADVEATARLRRRVRAALASAPDQLEAAWVTRRPGICGPAEPRDIVVRYWRGMEPGETRAILEAAVAVAGDGCGAFRREGRHPGLASGWRRSTTTEKVAAPRRSGSATIDARARSVARRDVVAWLRVVGRTELAERLAADWCVA